MTALLKFGHVAMQPSIKQTFYDDDGKVHLQLNFKPSRRTDCFISVFLGAMPKNTENPGEFARQRLIELGWSPPPDE